MTSVRKIVELSKEIKEHSSNLTDYEALQIACELEKINAFKKAFVISESDSHPSALEAIAMALGVKEGGR